MKNENNAGYVEFMISRSPKKIHDTMIQLNKPAKDLFRKVGVRQEIFQLSDIKDKEAENMGVTNVAKSGTARDDKEVWLELQFYEDSKLLMVTDDKGNKVLGGEEFYGD